MKFLAVSAIALLLSQQVTAFALPAGCLQTHVITATDSCTSVAAQFQLTEADFYGMNPGLHHSVQHDCDNLDNGKAFCVCMKAPCPVKEAAAGSSAVPAASAAASGSAPVVASSAAASSAAPVASAPVASASAAASASASPMSASASGASMASASASTAASSQTAAAKSSAAMTTAFGALTVGLVMTATTMML